MEMNKTDLEKIIRWFEKRIAVLADSPDYDMIFERLSQLRTFVALLKMEVEMKE
jgi:hypothetical protein